MRASHVHVSLDYAKPVDRVFAYLAEHENLGPVFGAKVERLRDGDDGERNGVGSVRRVTVGPLPPLEETVHEFVPNERIVYRITRGGPLKDHVGVLEFSELPDGGTHLEYRIRVATPLPGVGPVVAQGLRHALRRGLPQVDERA